jgi:hypothetical protein
LLAQAAGAALPALVVFDRRDLGSLRTSTNARRSLYTYNQDVARPIRTIAATVRRGRVSFNQVVMVRDRDQPSGLLLVGVDPEMGLYVWLRSLDDIEAGARDQVAGYSRRLGSIDPRHPPRILGKPVVVPSSAINPTVWGSVTTARTNALNKAVRELFDFA